MKQKNNQASLLFFNFSKNRLHQQIIIYRSFLEICIFKDKYNKTNSLIHTRTRLNREMYITQTIHTDKKKDARFLLLEKVKPAIINFSFRKTRRTLILIFPLRFPWECSLNNTLKKTLPNKMRIETKNK
jgi:hypothetical protein